MGTPWCVWLTLLLFYKAGSSRAEAGAMELSRILGDNVTFSLGIPAEQVKVAAWTVNTARSIVTVAAGNPPIVIVADPSYEGRLRVPESNSLQITSLRMEDTGTYSAQITATGTIHRNFTLRVYKPVLEPTVLCDSMNCVSETCNYNLSCTARDGGEHVTYSWTHTAGGAVVPNESILHISLSPRDAHLNVTCTAQNPVSNSSTRASAKDLCAAPTTTTTTATPPGSQSAIIAGILGFFLVIPFVMIVLWFVYKHKCKRASQKSRKSTSGPASSAEADAEKNTVYAQVGNLPLPHSRTGTPKASLETKKDETKTIYSKVHYPNESPPQTDDEKLSKDGLESTEKSERTIYATVNQPTQTKPAKSTDAADSAVTPKPQGPSEYDKII